MAYYVRLLTPSEKIIPASEIKTEIQTVRLAAGMDREWEKLEILSFANIILATVEREPVNPGTQGERDLQRLKNEVSTRSPASARKWLQSYLSTVKTIYAFQLLTDNISSKPEWQILGQVQNYLKDTLGGIIQADNEGFFNEAGDYILWQMYPGAGGTVPAATLDENGEWVPFQLKLDDDQAIERFKKGEAPRKGFWDVLLRR